MAAKFPEGPKQTGHPNLYKRGKVFYGKFKLHGKWDYRRLGAIGKAEANRERTTKQSDHDRSQLGLCKDPFAKETAAVTVGKLIRDWRSAGYHNGKRVKAATSKIDELKFHSESLEKFFNSDDPNKLSVAACDRYHDWRVQRLQANNATTGGRTVEKELSLLSVILTLAARAEVIPHNPIFHGKPKYVQPEQIKHCTESMPVTDEELHKLARWFFKGGKRAGRYYNRHKNCWQKATDEGGRGEVLGWQMLFEAMTGCRTNEILKLRVDASFEKPGYLDEHSLFVKRSKKGIFPYVLLDQMPGISPLRDLIEAHRIWHNERWPDSPWYFPGREDKGAQPVDTGSLTRALGRATKALELPHRTSHGLRAFYVRVARSQGISDSEIAIRLGQGSGVALVERTYGTAEPGWIGSKKLDWMPKGEAAWSAFTAGKEKILAAVGEHMGERTFG